MPGFYTPTQTSEFRETLTYPFWKHIEEELKKFCFKRNMSLIITQRTHRWYKVTIYLKIMIPHHLKEETYKHLLELKRLYP
jgi:hypothetical protein